MKKTVSFFLVSLMLFQSVFAEAVEVTVFPQAFFGDGNSSITFAEITAKEQFEILEYGILYSPTNPIPELGGTDVRKLEAWKSKNNPGQFGIELRDTQRILGKAYYTRPYAIYLENDVQKVVYSEKAITISAASHDAALREICLDGEKWNGFSPEQHDYTIPWAKEEPPVITGSPMQDTTLITEIKEAEGIPGTATVITQAEAGESTAYHFQFEKSSFDWENASGAVSWDSRTVVYADIEYPFRPTDKYQSEQNPPSFSWPYVDIAKGYELKVCRDEALTDIAYVKRDIKTNVYNFSYPFETGTYYWSVRFRTDEEVSCWSQARRFTILPDAYEFPVMDIEAMADILSNGSHPKLLVTEETLPGFRAQAAGSSQEAYNRICSTVAGYMENPLLTEPVFTDSSSFRADADRILRQITLGSFVYLISQNEEVGNFAKQVLLAVASWDPDGNTAYHIQDQVYGNIMESCVLGYDWLYPLLTEQERNTVRNMLIQRALTLNHPSEGLMDSPFQVIYSPFRSHGWGHMRRVLMAAIALSGETQQLNGLLEQYLPIYINYAGTQWGNEDGAYSNGFGYWTYSPHNKILEYTLLANQCVNLFDSAQWKNAWLFPMYTVSQNATMEFGDDNYGEPPSRAIANILKSYIQYSQSPYAKWQLDHLGLWALTGIYSYYDEDVSGVSAKTPSALPKAHYFKDAGYVAMHSNLTEEEDRVSLYFRSSSHGSQNHAHPDQNSFHIQAFGERLAIDSGYYDYYFSDFDLNYTRKTYAHNAITFDGGQGQPINTRRAAGEITHFITGPQFDLVSGEAAEAYNYTENRTAGKSYYDKKLDKAVRHIIYIRPDQFIVIDDLKAQGEDTHSFEWWLNAYENISLSPEGIGATIQKGKAVLDAQIHYPTNLTSNYSADFSGPDGVSYTPSGSFADRQVHKRVWFSTEPLNQAKIISTIDVHREEVAKKQIQREQFDSYLKLIFEDSTTVYIRTDDSETVTAGDIIFEGTAVVVRNSDFMLVDGTYLSVNGEEKVCSDTAVSVSVSGNQWSISASDDANLTVGTAEETEIIKDEKQREIPQNDDSYGCAWSKETGKLRFLAKKGFYSFFLVTTGCSADSGEGEIPVTRYVIQ